MGGGVDVERIGQIAVTVADVERAREFYRDVLGLRHLFDAPPRMSFFDCGGVRLLLGEAERAGGGSHGASIIYLYVPDIGRAHETLTARGVTFEQVPHLVADLGDRELWLAFFRDSEANVMALMTEKPK
ncbi:MAG TPA: VOC family protein [Longimicrobiales bacterium]